MDGVTNSLRSALGRATDEQRGVEIPPCLAQQFGGGDAIGNQARDTARRCDERASEEDAGAMMSDAEPLE